MVRTFDITPEQKTVPNVFDYFGLLVGLPRLPAEKNAVYRRRLWDTYVRKAGAHQRGLINGITRELGLEQYDALTITYIGPATNSPRVIVRDVQIELYSNWSLVDESIDANVLEMTIDIYSKDSPAYYLQGLVDTINTSSSFTASLEDGIIGRTLSAVLIDNDSQQWQEDEELKPFRRNKLEHTSVIPGTIRFTSGGNEIFVTQVATEEEVLADGDYYIDYTNGFVITYGFPAKATGCRYMYNTLPITLDASPVILHEFGSSYFRTKTFDQILQADGTYTDGLPHNEAIKYINELLMAKGMLWGR